MKKHPIHQSTEERLSAGTVAAVQESTQATKRVEAAVKDKTVETHGFLAMTKEQKATTRKVEEVKSAALVQTKLLKEIRDKKPQDKVSVSIEGISVLTLKGDKGDKGDSPSAKELTGLIKPLIPAPIKGDKGDPGERGADGIGRDGKDGKDGKDGIGRDGKDGRNGADGKDGSPDSPDEVVEKVNVAKKLIKPEKVRGLSDLFTQVQKYGSNPSGAAGGGPTYRFLQNGTPISQHVTELNFSTNLTGTYDGNGRITLTATDLDRSAEWGQITGTLSDQTDLQNVLDDKFELPSLTAGSVLFSNGTTIAQDNANLFWNDTDNRLNIGTNSGTAKLTVKGAGTTTGTTFRLTDSADRSLFEVNDAGFVGMSGAPSVLWKLDFTGQYFQMGSDSTSNNDRTNNTVKLFGIVTPAYANAANPTWGIGVQNTSVANNVFIGGGVTNGANAATGINFATASTTTGGVGAIRMALSNTILRIGSGDATTTPAAVNLLGPRVSGVADTAGTHWTTVSGLATGNANSGDFIFQTGAVGSTGSTIQTPTTRLIIKGGTGNVGIGTTGPTTLLDINSDAFRLRTAKTPASATATGAVGEICWDADYIYVCVATDTWKRSALTTW